MTAPCPATLGNLGGLHCTRDISTDPHEQGHVYRAAWAADAVRDEEVA